jgi:hypothetical protein
METDKKEKNKIKDKNKEAINRSEDIGLESFLIPRHFRNQSLYKSHTIFRFSLYLLIFILVVAGIATSKWIEAQKATQVYNQTQNLETEESTRIQTQGNVYRPIREKFKELESLRRQLRVPLTPILDGIEKTIPPEISINRFTSSCPPVASTSTLRRKMQIQMEIFIPNTIDADNPIIGSWPEKLAEYLEKAGLLVSEPNWGNLREYKRLSEDAKRKRVTQMVGSSKELNLTIELKPE